MDKTHIKKIITNALQSKDLTITDICPTPSGLTNKSYFATINSKKYVIRIPGSGTEELVNRKEEKSNLLYGTRLGINPPLLHFNTVSGLKITQKIEGAYTITPALAREKNTTKQIIHLLKHLHTAETPMKNTFKLFDLIDHYESLIQDVNDRVIVKLAELKKGILALQSVYYSFHIKKVPCHIDPICANLIKDKNGDIYLIDWEYSGMFDPLWDIATLMQSLNLQEEEQLFFLTYYLERTPTKEELQRILIQTIFLDYLWSLWSIFKKTQGDDVGNSAFIRLERAAENINLYNKTYNEDIVV